MKKYGLFSIGLILLSTSAASSSWDDPDSTHEEVERIEVEGSCNAWCRMEVQTISLEQWNDMMSVSRELEAAREWNRSNPSSEETPPDTPDEEKSEEEKQREKLQCEFNKLVAKNDAYRNINGVFTLTIGGCALLEVPPLVAPVACSVAAAVAADEAKATWEENHFFDCH